MKKTLYIIVVLCTLLSCNTSKEEKAEALVISKIKKNLSLQDSFKALEVKVDSAFAPRDNPALLDDYPVLAMFEGEIEAVAKDSALREEVEEKAAKLYDELSSLLKAERSFLGYKVILTYSVGDTKESDCHFFIVDKDCEKVLYNIPMVEYERIKTNIKKTFGL